MDARRAPFAIVSTEARDNTFTVSNALREWLWETYGARYSRPCVIKLMYRLGFEWIRPARLPKQAVRRCRSLFFANYERLVDGLPPDEKLVFADAVHAEHQSRPTHGWFLKGDRPAVNTKTGRRLVDIYGVLER